MSKAPASSKLHKQTGPSQRLLVTLTEFIPSQYMEGYQPLFSTKEFWRVLHISAPSVTTS
jgi:hypothetical protein